MKKVKALWNISDKRKRILRLTLYITLCVLIYSWTLVVGAQTWVESLILYENKSEVLLEIEDSSIFEVSNVYANGDFTIEGNTTVYTDEDISAYVRVPMDMKHYYQPENKYYIVSITFSESEGICLKYSVLDALCYIMLTAVLYDCMKSGKRWQKIVAWIFFVWSALLAQCCTDLTYGTLFGIGAILDILFVVRIVIPIGLWVVHKIRSKRKNA